MTMIKLTFTVLQDMQISEDCKKILQSNHTGIDQSDSGIYHHEDMDWASTHRCLLNS